MKTYTFHISLPEHGRIWRKVELTGENTLADLHLAIQDAYDFDNDHLYSFFMSGKAWDSATEYSLPEGVDPWGDLDDDPEDEEDKEEAGDDAPAVPTVQDLRMMQQLLQTDSEARSQYMQVLMQQTGLPASAIESMLQTMNELLANSSDEELSGILEMSSRLRDDTEAANDARITTIDALNLRKGKKFMYLFDYGDEWRFTIRLESVNPNGDATVEYPRLVESVGEAPPQYPDWDEEYEDEEDEAG